MNVLLGKKKTTWKRSYTEELLLCWNLPVFLGCQKKFFCTPSQSRTNYQQAVITHPQSTMQMPLYGWLVGKCKYMKLLILQLPKRCLQLSSEVIYEMHFKKKYLCWMCRTSSLLVQYCSFWLVIPLCTQPIQGMMVIQDVLRGRQTKATPKTTTKAHKNKNKKKSTTFADNISLCTVKDMCLLLLTCEYHSYNLFPLARPLRFYLLHKHTSEAQEKQNALTFLWSFPA